MHEHLVSVRLSFYKSILVEIVSSVILYGVNYFRMLIVMNYVSFSQVEII